MCVTHYLRLIQHHFCPHCWIFDVVKKGCFIIICVILLSSHVFSEENTWEPTELNAHVAFERAETEDMQCANSVHLCKTCLQLPLKAAVCLCMAN